MSAAPNRAITGTGVLSAIQLPMHVCISFFGEAKHSAQ